METLADSEALAEGVHPVDRLASLDLGGDEPRDLTVLARAGVPIADGWLVSVPGADASARLTRVISQAFHAATPSRVVRLRPLFADRAVAARLERRGGIHLDIEREADARAAANALVEALAASDVRPGADPGPWVRVLVGESAPIGRAASADPILGDPDQVRVWEPGAAPWLVDRRTARVVADGSGHLDRRQASLVADLADRVQLALGRPVEIEWTHCGGELRVLTVRPIELVPAFASTTFGIVALIAPDEGTVAPMSVDALDRALRTGDEPPDEARVQRIYARPYRRVDGPRGGVRTAEDPKPLTRAGATAVRVLADLASPLHAVQVFERELASRLEARDRVPLRDLDDDTLVAELRDRQRDVASALRLLDRTRRVTKASCVALEATVGGLPSETILALAHPRPTRLRRRVYERLARMARQIEEEVGGIEGPEALSPALVTKWQELRSSLSDVRELGLDIRPEAYGSSDTVLLSALRARPAVGDAVADGQRRDAISEVTALARQGPFGRSREALATSLLVALGRIARAKGGATEALASVWLRQRQGALEAGRRLAEAGLIDEPVDVLHTFVAEVGQALGGEPGAYAARIRLRRENDARWAHFAAPRRIKRRRR